MTPTTRGRDVDSVVTETEEVKGAVQARRIKDVNVCTNHVVAPCGREQPSARNEARVNRLPLLPRDFGRGVFPSDGVLQEVEGGESEEPGVSETGANLDEGEGVLFGGHNRRVERPHMGRVASVVATRCPSWRGSARGGAFRSDAMPGWLGRGAFPLPCPLRFGPCFRAILDLPRTALGHNGRRNRGCTAVLRLAQAGRSDSGEIGGYSEVEFQAVPTNTRNGGENAQE